MTSVLLVNYLVEYLFEQSDFITKISTSLYLQTSAWYRVCSWKK